MVLKQARFDIDHLILPDPESIEFHPLIYQHLSWLADENERYNITTVPSEKWIIRHVIDSIAPLHAGWIPGTSLLDLGTGGGFPGLPLALQAQLPRFVLLDSKRKLTEGLNGFMMGVGLSARGVSMPERAETLGHRKGFRETYDRVVVRAVASLPTLVELGIPFLVPEGELWCWKSDLEEISISEAAFEQLNA